MNEQMMEVRKWGNGAGILVPREWLGDKVIVVRKPKKPIKEQILEVLTPHLEHILGAYLYGSRARGDETDDSDIDLFVVSDRKIEIKQKGFEIVVLQENEIPSAFEGMSALMTYSILAEAKPIINSELLARLRKEFTPKLKDFNVFVNNTKSIINRQKEIIELDIQEKSEYVYDEATSYSLILRLRGTYLINCLLSRKPYRKQDFDSWVKNKSDVKDYEAVYRTYISVKNDKKEKHKVSVSDLVSLNDLLINEISKIETKIYGKKRKKT